MLCKRVWKTGSSSRFDSIQRHIKPDRLLLIPIAGKRFLIHSMLLIFNWWKPNSWRWGQLWDDRHSWSSSLVILVADAGSPRISSFNWRYSSNPHFFVMTVVFLSVSVIGLAVAYFFASPYYVNDDSEGRVNNAKVSVQKNKPDDKILLKNYEFEFDLVLEPWSECKSCQTN